MLFLKKKIIQALEFLCEKFKCHHADSISAGKARKALKDIEEMGA